MMSQIPLALQEEIDELARRFDEAAAEIQQSQPEDMRLFADPEQYQRQVIPLELDLMRRRQAALKSPKVLVLLCGTSLQPLLVSAAFIKPAQVLLVGSETQEGRDAVARIRPLITCPVRPESIFIHDSDPRQGYAELHNRLKSLASPDEVLVDITGGKKTMVVATFLAAARLGLRMVYVDGKQDPRAALPRPGTLYVRSVEDPAAYFWLRELKDAAAHFSKGSYTASAALYEQVAKAAEKDAATSLFPVQKLRQAAAGAIAAGHWEQASYAEAAQALSAQGVPVPRPLQILAELWGTDDERRLELFASSQRRGPEQGGRGLLRFTADRLAWAYRAYRSGRTREAFLRGFAACDTALEGLVIWLLKNNRLQLDGKTFSSLPKSMHSLMARVRGSALLETGIPLPSSRDRVIGFTGLGEPYRVFAQRDSGSNDEIMREHRNALIHRISAPNTNLIRHLLEASPGRSSLAENILRAVGHAIEIRDTESKEILQEALGDPDLRALRTDLPDDL